MFRVYRLVADGVWQEEHSMQFLWARWMLEELWNGKIVEYKKGSFWTMEVPEGNIKLPYKE